MRTVADDTMFQMACGFSMVQLPITMAIISYHQDDPQFSMYTTQLLNTTTKQMEVDVEDFSSSILYIGASAVTALFALASRNHRIHLNADAHYCVESLQEIPMWDLSFWAALLLQHACLVGYMCSPLDWYFLVLEVSGISLLLLLISRLPLVSTGGGRSRENILMLLFGMLYFILYTAVRRHASGHVVFFAAVLFFDALMLVGHTFDSNPNMQTVGNCRLCYCAGMSVVLLVSYGN